MRSKHFLKKNKIKIIKSNRYEILISISKSILRIKNIYKVNGNVIRNGKISFIKNDRKCIAYLFFIILKINENNK